MPVEYKVVIDCDNCVRLLTYRMGLFRCEWHPKEVGREKGDVKPGTSIGAVKTRR
jgi:hypothetical protein